LPVGVGSTTVVFVGSNAAFAVGTVVVVSIGSTTVVSCCPGIAVAVGPTVAAAILLVGSVGMLTTAAAAVGVPDSLAGTIVCAPGGVGTVARENVIVSTTGPIATHDVFTVYEPATFDVNATLNVVSLTFDTDPTTTSDVGLPSVSNTRTSN